jgi:anti-sigma factor RsiW
MKEEILTDTLLRQYLLGRVDDAERQRIEKLFITDSQARERVLAAEQELIEDYLEDSLSTADKEIFLAQYARTPEQQRKLRITGSIKDWAITKATAPSGSSLWSRFRERLQLRPVFVVPVVATVLIAIVIASIWLVERRRSLALEREVAELNSFSSLSQNPPQMVPLQLTPVSVRSGEAQNQLTKRADIRVVDLDLLLIQRERYPAYHAVVHRFGEKRSIVTVDIEAKDSNKIRLRLPAELFDKGSFQIELSGLAADGSVGPSEEYTFVVDQ